MVPPFAHRLEVKVDPPLYLRPAPVLIGREKAEAEDGMRSFPADKCISDKAQRSGLRASASLPRRRTDASLELQPELIRREDWEGFGAEKRICRSWQLKLSAPPPQPPERWTHDRAQTSRSFLQVQQVDSRMD
ncbi:hypothetical protein ILYODFUR_002989 [Ilyodon furcidens]|uniref:Uncharacterized protein n=1 Tax=Ilyodon furcidens TaxID=33524 RepID=A0ABV0VCB3_9TELE